MPELPEIETVVRELGSRVEGKEIRTLKVSDPTIVRRPESDQLAEKVEGKEISAVKRKGKYILFKLAGEKILAIHLRMTGKLVLKETSKYERLSIALNGDKLILDDMRRFGTLDLVESSNSPPLNKLGIDPLSKEYTWNNFRQIIDTEREIKRVLLDQKRLAGLGNIYVNEILFRTKISPWEKAKDISSTKKENLYQSIKETLKEAIEKKGTTIKDFRTTEGEKGGFQNELQVYSRNEKKCKRCGSTVSKEEQGGRTTYFCPSCQSGPD